jgi:ATP-dependent protease ClpP protease subunit
MLKRKYDVIMEKTDQSNDDTSKKASVSTNAVPGGDLRIINTDNHIYFYCSVTKQSCLDLNKKIREVTNDILKVPDNLELKKYIYLHINSFGGSVYAALSTIDTILTNRIPIISIIEGGAASAATMISIVCGHRIVHKNSYMLIHQLSSAHWGKFEDLKDDMKNSEQLMEQIIELYLKYTKLSREELVEILKHDRWWCADKCLEAGLVDEVVKDVKKKYGIDKKKIKL